MQRHLRPQQRQRRDDGFTLIEVVAAITMIGLMVIFTLPITTGSIRATGFAGRVLDAKSVAQAELERMRGLPFHVAVGETGDGATLQSGVLVRPKAIDLLDTYVRNGTAAPSFGTKCAAGDFSTFSASSGGWVTSTTGSCTAWELQPPFFRVVRPDSAATPYTVVVNAQFIRGTALTTADLPAGYDSMTKGFDSPVTRDLRVTVAVGGPGLSKPVQLTSYVSDPGTKPTRLLTDLAATALRVSTVTTSGGLPLDVGAGVLEVRGSSTASTSMDVFLAGVETALGGADAVTVRGATIVRSLPPDSQALTDSDALNRLPSGAGNCAQSVACWPSSVADAPGISTAFGSLTAGSSFTPLLTYVAPKSNSDEQRMRVNQPVERTDLGPLTGLDAVRVEKEALPGTSSDSTPCTAGGKPVPDDAVGARGWATASRDRLIPVEVCSTSRTTWVHLLPPESGALGRVRIAVPRAAAYCRTGSGNQATASIEALVQVRVGTDTWRNVVRDTGKLPPLDAVPLENETGTVDLTPFLDSWSLGTPVTTSTATRSSVSLDAAISIRTVALGTTPAGEPDPETAISVELGSVSCQVQDRR